MNGTFRSRGISHHADVRVTCPSCGRKFEHPHHAGVAELPGPVINVQFKSKQDGRWGVVQVPAEDVCWGETRTEAYDCLKSRE